MRKSFVGGAPQTTLATTMTTTTPATITLGNGTGYPTGSPGPFVIVIDRGLNTEEKILCSLRSGNVLTISQRGYDDTVPSAHSIGASVFHVLDATTIDEANAHANGDGTDHSGLAPSVHNHTTAQITSGAFTVARGGTGRSTLTSGYFLTGNGTSAINMITPAAALTAIGAAASSHAHPEILFGVSGENTHVETDPPSAYPLGLTITAILSAFSSNWPTPGTWGSVATTRASNDSYRHSQYYYANDGEIWHRSGTLSNTWGPWNRVSFVGHDHDGRYYTEAETNSLLTGKADSVHTHTIAQVSGTVTPAQGGTGLVNPAANTYLRTNGTGSFVARTYADVRSDIGAAAAAHTHNAATDLTGVVPNAQISGTYTGLVSLTGSGTVDFAKFLGNASDTVGAPSFSWTGDTNTGIWRPAADQIGFSIGGTNRFTILASGATVVGTLTATTFSGSGASLTDLPTTSLTGLINDANLPGRISAASYSGETDANNMLANGWYRGDVLNAPASGFWFYSVVGVNGVHVQQDAYNYSGGTIGTHYRRHLVANVWQAWYPVYDTLSDLQTQFYTEAEVNGFLAAKSNTGHTHAATEVNYAGGTGVSAGTVEAALDSLATLVAGKAATSHNHDASNINAGTLVASRGGTGLSAPATGNYMKTAGSSAFSLMTPAQVLADIGAAGSGHTHAYASDTHVHAYSAITGTVPNAAISGSYTGLGSLTGNGQVQFLKYIAGSADTVGFPGFTWTNDENTGMWHPADDNIGFATNGVNRMQIDQFGDVQVFANFVATGGTFSQLSVTSAPTYGDAATNKTYVDAQIATRSISSHTHSYAATSHNHSATNITSGTLADARLSGSYTGLASLTGSGTLNFDRLLVNNGVTSDLAVSFSGAYRTGLYATGVVDAETLNLRVGGLAGLDVSANLGVTIHGNSEVLTIKPRTTGASQYIGFYRQSSATRTAYIGHAASANDNLYINADTANANILLSPGTGGQILTLDGTAAKPAYSFASASTTGMYVLGTTLYFTVGGSIGLHITSGNTRDFYGGVLNGVNEIRADDGSAGDPAYAFSSDETQGMYRWSSAALGFSVGGEEFAMASTVFRPNTHGTVGLGASSIKWSNIYAVSSSGIGSDRTIKHDIRESALGLDFILDLKPVSYVLNGRRRTHYGLIAQEVKESLDKIGVDDFGGYLDPALEPEPSREDYDSDGAYKFALSEWERDKEGTLMLRYEEFIAPSIRAIQEQQQIIKSQADEIAELKRQMAAVMEFINA